MSNRISNQFGGVTFEGAKVHTTAPAAGINFHARVTSPGRPSGSAMPRLPHYMTHEGMRRMGFSKDVINALNPRSTPIGYHSAAENQKREDAYYRKYGRDNKHIPTYKSDSRVVRGEVNPQGKDGLGHAYSRDQITKNQQTNTLQAIAAREFQYSKSEVKEIIDRQFSQGISKSVAIIKALDLPHEKTHVADVRLKPGNYIVEISFTMSGSQQVGVPNVKDRRANIENYNIRPIRDF